MSTSLRIARRDFTELARTGRLYWAIGLIWLLLITALAVGWQRQTELRAERSRAAALDYDDWVKQPERHPHDAAHQGMHVFKPEVALSIIDPGVTPFVGSTLWLRAHRQSEVKFRPAQDATGLQRFGSLSAAWILQLLGPLLVIVLGFAAISAEREHGTLRLLLSHGVSPRQLLLGKTCALALTLAAVLAPVSLVAGAVVLMAAEPGVRAEAVLRLATLGFGYALYLGIFVCIVLAVSARASSSRLALVWLLGLWIATTLLAPRLIADLSRTLIPSESRREFDSHLESDLDDTTQRAWVEHFGGGTPFGPGVSMGQWGVGLRVHDHAGYTVMDRHFGELWQSYAHQQRVQEWAGLLVPTLAMRAFSMGIAGSDFEEHRSFSTAAEAHRRVMQDLISDDLVDHADGHGEQHFGYRADTKLWNEVPPFEYRPAGFSAALRCNLRSLGVLAAGLLFAAWLALRSVSRNLVGA